MATIATTIMTSIKVKPELRRSDRVAVVVCKSFSNRGPWAAGLATTSDGSGATGGPAWQIPINGGRRPMDGGGPGKTSTVASGRTGGDGAVDVQLDVTDAGDARAAQGGRSHVGRPQPLLEAGTDVRRQAHAVEQDAGNDDAAVADQHLEGDAVEPECVERVQVESPVAFRLGR